MNLTDGLPGAIGDFIENYFTDVNDVVQLAKAAPMDPIDGFPTTQLWNASKSISLSVGMGIASTVVALFMFFELASLFNRSDTKGWDGIYWIMMVFLKVAVMMTICKNMTTIIGMIFQISSAVTQNVIDSGLFSKIDIDTSELAKDIEDYYADATIWDGLGGWVVGLLAKLVSALCFVLAKVVCMLRFVEIYVFNSVAPIAFCTFVSREYKQIGIAFIKRMLALGLQGAFIAIVCALYTVIVTTTIDDLTIGDDGAISTMLQLAGYSILMIIAIFQTGGWSKSLLQVQ